VASFTEEVNKAAEGLQKFNQALRPRDELGRFVSGGGASGGGGGGGGGFGGGISLGGGRAGLAAGGLAGGALAAGGLAIDGLNSAARFLTPAANAFATTGTSQGVASAVNSSLINAVGSTAIGGLILAGSGVAAAQETTQRAAGRVGAVTEDLARYGIEVSDDFRKRLADSQLEQEKRVSTERGKVQELLGSTDALERAKPEGAGAVFDSILGVLKSIESKINGRGGAL